jgi:WHG domain-containing protein
MAFRDWALAHPNLFRLVFAMPGTGLAADPAVAPAGQAGLTQVRNRVERARAAGLLADRPASEVTVEWHALCVGLASVELGGALMNAAKAERMWRGSLTAAAGGCPGQDPERFRVSASHRLARGSARTVRVFEFMPLSSAPGRIRTCAHGCGGHCRMTLLPGKMRRSRPVGERMGSAKARTPAVTEVRLLRCRVR